MATELAISKFCSKIGISRLQFEGKEAVDGYLYLGGLTSIPDGFNPTVGSYLDLNGLTSIPDGFNPTVGGSLYLNGLTSIPDGFNPTVGGVLYLSGLTSIPDGFNPTVGGGLYLSGLASIPDGFNPTVGGYLYLSGLNARSTKPPCVITWNSEKHCMADGIFAEVISKKKSNDLTIWKLRKIRGERLVMVSSDTHAAHGDTVRDAMLDLRFKQAGRDSSAYDNMTIDSELSLDDAIVFYRVITGSCRIGVNDFLNNRLKDRKLKYKVSEIIKLTKGEYGSEKIVQFFSSKL